MSNLAASKRGKPPVVFRRVEPHDVPSALTSPRVRESLSSTRHYVGTCAGRDVVRLSVERFPTEFRVDEIQVVGGERRRGFGAAALAHAETVARESGAFEMTLQPLPLDTATSLSDLRDWYAREGFAPVDVDGLLFAKRLVPERGL